jgi:hypothetical protein
MVAGKSLAGLVSLVLIGCLLAFSSCRNRSPNLSERKLLELMDEKTNTLEVILPDSSYLPPEGAKYTEIRAIDPASPPEIIDIVGNLGNKKAFKLSDFASSVKYIHLQQPPDIKFAFIRDVVSDDESIFVNTREGLFCYSTEGRYLYTLCVNELETSSTSTRIVHGILNNVDLLNGRLIYRTYYWPSPDEGVTDIRVNVFDVNELNAQMLFNIQPRELRNTEPKPKYQWRVTPANRSAGFSSRYLLMDDQSLFISNSLTGVAIYGDTLCKFNDYDLPTLAPDARRVVSTSYTYRIDGQVMLQREMNDTVFRVIPPNRFIPAYIMNWGEYKPDINQHAAGSDLDGKLVQRNWVETLHYIFIEYTEGRAYPARWNQGKVKHHWAIYDKTAKTLLHHLTPDIPPMIEAKGAPFSTRMPISPLFENDIEPVGMPFWPIGVNHKGEMYMTFSKEQIKSYIKTERFQNDKLQEIYVNMPDDGFCLMIVK